MNILGIDYGRKKIGLALSSGSIAFPYKVLRIRDKSEIFEKLEQIIKIEKVEKIVVGISEGKMGEESRNFGRNIERHFNTPVFFSDETLTSFDAQKFSIEAGIKQSKRKRLEDAYAAALILQGFIDDTSHAS